MFNIQINYDINQALDLKSCNSEFYVVSLYRFIEYLASNVKNIKDSLNRMEKYIKGKSIIKDNPNSIKYLDGVGKAVWDFFSAFYEAHWDSLYMDDSNMSFRSKVKSKFIPQATKTSINNKDKEQVKLTYISSLSLPILATKPKEVNSILKFFKKNDNLKKKSYAQASSKSQNNNVVMNTLKIKEMFPKLQN